MKISKLIIQNFRKLRDVNIEIEDDLSLVVGKNNTGKTSVITVLDKFYNKHSFNINDFNLDSMYDFINSITNNQAESSINESIKIKLQIHIEYDNNDNLSILKDFLLDLNMDVNLVIIEFSLDMNSINIFKHINKLNLELNYDNIKKIIKKEFNNISKINIRALHYSNPEYYKDIDIQAVRKLLYLNIIDAKRNVDNEDNNHYLSKQIQKYYDHIKNGENTKLLKQFSKNINGTNKDITDNYSDMFQEVVTTIKDKTSLDFKIISNIQSFNLIQNSTSLTYNPNNKTDLLPENYNGLGYMNFIAIIIEVLLIKKDLEKNSLPLNLVIIEEPEAHTHPQQQYNFLRNIKDLLKVNNNIQKIITTHSSHILSTSDINDVKYLMDQDNIIISKNVSDVEQQYENNKKDFGFLKQYLTLEASDLFFTDKAIFIEGTSERMLIKTMMQKVDEKLLEQNISILEVGNYSHKFKHFLNFLGIKTLIITDIDSTKKDKASSVVDGDSSSNASIKDWLNLDNNNLENIKHKTQSDRTIDSHILLSYQEEEEGYFPRSFEDAFININYDKIFKQKKHLQGLKNIHKITKNNKDDIYTLTNCIIDKKSKFAISILYYLNDFKTPKYIEEGLKWLAK